MKILIACEFSQIVTKAFRDRGHEAFSCDILPTEGNPDWHIQGDVLEILGQGWDMMIAHPPCTYISFAGTRWWNDKGRVFKRIEALQFFAQLWEAPIEKICIENPRSCASPTVAKHSQEIHPYFFGDEFSKPTWLWLKKLPLLIHTKETTLFEQKTHVGKGDFTYHVDKNGKLRGDATWYYMQTPGPDRWKNRAKTFPGIANAMAEQWG